VRILLLAMPDVSDALDYFVRMPNLALVSLAGNLPGHEVRVLDLVAVRRRLRATLTSVMAKFRPELVGLSAMTFQFDTLLRVARFLKRLSPGLPVAAGGYHASLLARELPAAQPDLPLDFIVRGEGEFTLQELADALETAAPPLSRILGLSYRDGTEWRHNPDRPLSDPALIRLPRREARLCQEFYILKWPTDVVETSRGCPFKCKFCSINQMYGPHHRKFPVEWVMADLEQIRDRGVQSVFFTDDNITFDPAHFRDICQAILDRGLNQIRFTTQVSARDLAQHPDLVPLMARANLKLVFVGYESMDSGSLGGMRKPSVPEDNRRVAELFYQHGIHSIAGCIVGYPDDTWRTVIRNFSSIKRLRPDVIYAQFLTPYPRTTIRAELLAAGLVENVGDFRHYDGFTCNIRTRHLSRASLHRVLKLQNILCNFDPRMFKKNHLLLEFPVYYAGLVGRSILFYLTSIVKAGRFHRTFDLD